MILLQNPDFTFSIFILAGCEPYLIVFVTLSFTLQSFLEFLRMKRCQATCHIAIWPIRLLASDWICARMLLDWAHGLDGNNKRCGKRFPPFKKLISICIFLPQLFTAICICYCSIVYLDVRIDLWLRYIFGTWPKKLRTFAINNQK